MYEKILVPIDGSSTSQCGLREAIALVKCQGGHLRLFHMVDLRIYDCGYASGSIGGDLLELARVHGRNVLSQAAELAQASGLHPETVMMDSTGHSAAALILDQASEWPADLIVMAIHGRHGFLRLALGSNAESVVRSATVPVLLVHGKVPESQAAERAKAASDAAEQVLYA